MSETRPALAPLVGVLSWIVVTSATWFAVAGQAWALTLLITAVGGIYLFFPPSGTFPRPILALFVLLLLLAGMAFLPATWTGSHFRTPLLEHGIILPWTSSPQPWLSLENFTLLFATLLWAWNCFETKLSAEQRHLLLTCFLVALGLIAVSTIVSRTPFEQSLPSFFRDAGQFANRNQTGNLLVMGGIFAFAHGLSSLAKRKSSAIYWIALAIIFLTAIILNGSRAALILFGLGLLLFSNLKTKVRYGNTVSWSISIVVIVVGTLIFALVGTELQDRFLTLTLGNEGRLGIYQDAFSLVIHHPVLGVGLGNFEGVFNTIRDHSASQQSRCIHPESDWLWIASEMGITGVILFALLIFLTFRIYLQKTPFQHLTKASFTIAVLFLIHSFFDVGGHRLGTMWSCLYLVGMGASRTVSPTDWKLPPVILRLAGLLLLVVAAFRIESMSLQPLMPIQDSVDRMEDALDHNLSFTEQKSLLDRGINWVPLDWYFYYRRGLLSRQENEPLQNSDADFNRALFLEQNSFGLPYRIGVACIGNDSQEALSAWNEYLNRTTRAEGQRDAFLANLFEIDKLDDAERLNMMALAGDDPTMVAIAIAGQGQTAFDGLCQNFLKANPTLQGVAAKSARKLFDRWLKVGNVDQLLQDWPLHPEWQSPGWRAYAGALGKTGRYQEAVATGLRFMTPPSLPNLPVQNDLAEAERLHHANPKDLYPGILLYFAQVSAGQKEPALATLKEVASLPNPPDYMQYLLVKGLYDSGQNETAWNYLALLLKEP